VRKALRYLKTVQGRPFKRTDDAFDALARLEAVAEAARNVAYSGHYRVSDETARLWDALRALDEEQVPPPRDSGKTLSGRKLADG